MVYDPIRDCEVPSPAITRRPSLWDNPPPPQPPALSDNLPPPSSARPLSGVSGAGGGGGSLRNLLNEDGNTSVASRRGSDLTASSHDDTDHSTTRPHLAKLLNTDTTSPLVRPTSASSSSRDARDASSPRLSSPSVGLHPHVAGGPSRASRSPLLHNQALSSPSTSMGYPYDVHTTPGAYGGPSSRRSSMDTSRPMPPPADPYPIRTHDAFNTPLAQTAPLRSPSVSVSPRQSQMHLPTSRHGSARPTSSHSAAGSAGHHHSATHSSPEPARRHSEDMVVSPTTYRAPYDPAQPSHTHTIRRPISSEELSSLRSAAVRNNPLRRRGRRSAPHWSAPSPHASTHGEGDDHVMSRSHGTSRHGSVSSSTAERPAAPSRENSGGDGKRKNSEPVPERNQRRRTQNFTGVAHEVASHYNQRQEVGVEQRELSPIIGLKKFNNWVKSVLIGKFTDKPEGRARGAKVLDIGCGKGGDLNKWRQARISLYVGMDIAATSVDQARERWNMMRGNRFEAHFYAHDCFGKPISDVLPDFLQREQYTNVTMQFCMHYAFETAQKARMMIENVSRYLRRGGKFIGTIPNSQLLLDRLELVPQGNELRFGNSCYTVSFKERRSRGLYGHEYRFYLEDAVEDVPEYIVDWNNFVNLAAEYGLELIYRKTFNDVLQEEQGSRDFGPLLGKMGVINEVGESAMDTDQWEAANLYMAFAFEKIR